MYLAPFHFKPILSSAATLASIYLLAIFGLHSTAADANVASQIELIPPQSIVVSKPFEIQIKASFKNTPPRLRMLNAPQGSSLDDHQDGTATFTWTPDTDTPDETVVIFQALDVGALQSVNIQRVVFRTGGSPAPQKAIETVPAVAVKTEPVDNAIDNDQRPIAENNNQASIVEDSKPTETEIAFNEEPAPPKVIAVKNNPAPPKIATASMQPVVEAGMLPAGPMFSQHFKAGISFLFMLSYMAFFFIGESANPIKFKGISDLRKRWQFGRAAGVVVFLSGLLCLMIKEYLFLDWRTTALAFLILIFVFIIPFAFQYQRAKVWS